MIANDGTRELSAELSLGISNRANGSERENKVWFPPRISTV